MTEIPPSQKKSRRLLAVAGLAVLAALGIRLLMPSPTAPSLPPIEEVRLRVPTGAEPAVAEAIGQGEQVVRSLLAQYPDDPAALYLAGDLCRQFGDSRQALALWERCLALEPRCVEAYIGRGTVCFEQGRFDDAASALAQALALRPESVEAAIVLAHVQLNRGRTEAVVELLAPRARSPAAPMPCHLLLGQAYLQRKEYSRAASAFRSAIRLAPEHASAYYGLATCCRRSGKVEEAARWMGKFKELESTGLSGRLESAHRPDDTVAVRATVATACATAASLFDQRGDRAQAEALFQASSRFAP